jgi:hypothetical protein
MCCDFGLQDAWYTLEENLIVMRTTGSYIYFSKSLDVANYSWHTRYRYITGDEVRSSVWITMMATTGNPISQTCVKEMAEDTRKKRPISISSEGNRNATQLYNLGIAHMYAHRQYHHIAALYYLSA